MYILLQTQIDNKKSINFLNVLSFFNKIILRVSQC